MDFEFANTEMPSEYKDIMYKVCPQLFVNMRQSCRDSNVSICGEMARVCVDSCIVGASGAMAPKTRWHEKRRSDGVEARSFKNKLPCVFTLGTRSGR